MATILLHAGVAAGAMAAILSGRYITDPTVESYSEHVIIAGLIADAVIAHAPSITLDDDLAIEGSIEILAAQITEDVLHGRDLSACVSNPPVVTDFLTIALCIACAICQPTR